MSVIPRNMNPSVAAALISGGAGLVGGIASNLFNIGSVQDANDTNFRIARENRDFMYQQWQRENAYNDPSAVMQRLARAGLNPNLMYGEGAGGLSSSATMQAVDQGRVAAPQVDPLMAAQIANISADTALKNAQADNQSSQSDLAKNQIKVGDSVALRNLSDARLNDSQVQKLQTECDYLAKLTDKVNSDILVNGATIQNMTVSQQLRWMDLVLRSKEVDAVCDKYAADAGYTREQIKYAGILAMAKVYNLRADTALKKAQEGLTNKQADEVEQAIANMQVQNGQMSWDLQMSKEFGREEHRLKLSQAVSEILSNGAQATRGTFLGIFSGSLGADYDDFRNLVPGSSSKF